MSVDMFFGHPRAPPSSMPAPVSKAASLGFAAMLNAVLDAYKQEMPAVLQRSQAQEDGRSLQEERDESMLPDMTM